MEKNVENSKKIDPDQLEINFDAAEKIELERKERQEIADKFKRNGIEIDKSKLLKDPEIGWCILPDYSNEIIPIEKYFKEQLEKLKNEREEKEEDQKLPWWKK